MIDTVIDQMFDAPVTMARKGDWLVIQHEEEMMVEIDYFEKEVNSIALVKFLDYWKVLYKGVKVWRLSHCTRLPPDSLDGPYFLRPSCRRQSGVKDHPQDT